MKQANAAQRELKCAVGTRSPLGPVSSCPAAHVQVIFRPVGDISSSPQTCCKPRNLTATASFCKKRQHCSLILSGWRAGATPHFSSIKNPHTHI